MADEEPRLFEMDPLPGIEPEPVELESYGRRVTRRNNNELAKGIHPATRLPVRADLGKCETCNHAHNYSYHARSYWKCARHRLGETHSAASDIRRGWPACEAYQPRPDDLGGDTEPSSPPGDPKDRAIPDGDPRRRGQNP